MLINLRNALMAGKRLPYDAEVEYLESTGTQYIPTGITPDENTRWELTVQFPASGAFMAMGSIYAGTPRERFIIGREGNGNLNISFGAPDHPLTIKGLGAVHTMTLDAPNLTWTVDGTSGTFDSATLLHVAQIVLFARNRSSTGGVSLDAYCTNTRVYGCKIWQNGVLVRDYIAVRKGTVGYLYDRVSGKLFGNDGTGDFVLGQDVVPVEYIESHGTEYIDLDYLQAGKLRIKFDASIASSYTGGEMDLLSNQYTAVVVGRFVVGVYQSRFFAYSRYVDNDGNATSDIVSPDTMYSVDCTFDTGNNTKTLSVDGADFTADKCTDISNRYSRVRLFSAANNLTSTWKGKIKFMKMWKDDVLWYNHIPVRVGTDATSWEGAMMDVLTRRIYRNAGTGAFSYGNDLRYPIPAE